MSNNQNTCLSIRYAAIFAVFAGILAWLAVVNGGMAWILVWAALSFLMVAAAYGGMGVAVFGKKPDGSRAAWATVCLWPYLAVSWLTWAGRRLASREPCCTEIVSGLWLGRRPYMHELPPQTACVVDLTCEFIVANGVVAVQCDYISLPVLDTLVPSQADFSAVLEQASACSGVVYVHCAFGHGRSAVFAAAMLLKRRIAKTPVEAVQLIRSVRPAVRLSRRQLKFLEQFF